MPVLTQHQLGRPMARSPHRLLWQRLRRPSLRLPLRKGHQRSQPARCGLAQGTSDVERRNVRDSLMGCSQRARIESQQHLRPAAQGGMGRWSRM
nr:hypothetical protein [Variovorax beijingensis]